MTFRWSNFTGDPFAITTVLFGVIAWIVAIAGAGASVQRDFPHFGWWGVVYQICIIFIVFMLYLNGNIELYKFTLVGLLAIAFVYTTNTTNSLIYKSDPGNLACAAGCILLSMLNIIWIAYFGGHPESPTNQFIDSFSLKNSNNHHLADEKNDDYDYKKFNQPMTSQPSIHEPVENQQPPFDTNKFISSQLNGLENSDRESTRRTYSTIPFRYKAKALYSYEANPEDANEISFIQGELLDVDDIDGKWWQARKANGQVGICPSNYVKLIET